VPYGVSSGLGAAGYSSTAAEIARQATAAGFAPSAIVHCSGSGATQAGLVLGAGVCLPETRIVGIDIDAEPARVAADVLAYGRAAADLLDLPFDENRLEALVLDPVYSGKGMAGLIALIRGGRWARAEHVVFVHTGGAPAIFAYLDALDL
jgi:L-cysteate sulfo-lyase